MNKFKLVPIGLITFFILIWIPSGLLLGGSIFLKITSIPINSLKLDTLIYYWLNYGSNHDIVKWLQFSSFISFIFIITFPAIVLVIIISKDKEEIHGSARFANDRELNESGLFKKTNTEPTLLLGKMDKGKFHNKYIKLEGKGFVGLSAPTGSGKGISFVIPNAVNYSDSLVCLDIKLENFFKSAGFRKKSGQEVFLFAPDGYSTTQEDSESGLLRSHRWNPFSYIRKEKAYRIGDVQLIGMSFYPPSGDPKADLWQDLARNIFCGLIYWMLDTEEYTGVKPTFPYMLSLIGIEGGFYKWIECELQNECLSPECKKEFSSFLDAPDETRGSIRVNLEAPLSIFLDKTVSAAVSDDDFDLRDLRRKGMTIYVGVQPPNKKRFQHLLNLFFEQLISENTRVIPELDKTLTHQLLLLLDEFPVLGRVNQIKESIGYTRQYNLRYALVYQDKSQLEDKMLYDYSGAENIITNLSCEIIFPPKKVTQRVKEISASLGTKTVKVRNTSVNFGGRTSNTNSYSWQPRELLKPHEIIELGYETHNSVDVGIKSLFFKENQRPFIIKKILYFEDPLIMQRVEYSKNNCPDIPFLDI